MKKTIAIHPKEWRDFCESFTQLNRGSMMTVELQHMDNRRDTIAENEMFRRMTLDMSDACNNMISLSLGEEGNRRIHHIAIEPIHLRLKQFDDGQKILQIEAENGVTLLTFHSGRFPQREFESEFSTIEPKAKAERGVAIPS